MQELVTLPQLNDGDNGWHDSGEGGLAFYALVPEGDRVNCCVTGVLWGLQDVVHPAGRWRIPWEGDHTHTPQLAAGVLLGSTNMSLFNDIIGDYFIPTYEDLTDLGKQLFDVLTAVYGEKPDLVTLLDT